MKIVDQGTGVAVLCDACGADVKGRTDTIVGLHGREQVIVHPWCQGTFDYYFRVNAERTLTLAQFVAELQAAAGV
jgi:hypothetical protein